MVLGKNVHTMLTFTRNVMLLYVFRVITHILNSLFIPYYLPISVFRGHVTALIYVRNRIREDCCLNKSFVRQSIPTAFLFLAL